MNKNGWNGEGYGITLKKVISDVCNANIVNQRGYGISNIVYNI
jgi:hypothetical protein